MNFKIVLNSAFSNNFFVFPVKKKDGFFNLVVQNQEKSFIYTFLDDYKKNPETASPFLVITLFDELLFQKGIVLVRGDIIGDLSIKEAEIVFQMTKDFYSIEHLYKKVYEFNKQSRKFDINSHINFCLEKYFSESNMKEEESDNFSHIDNKINFDNKSKYIDRSPQKRGANPFMTTFSVDTKK